MLFAGEVDPRKLKIMGPVHKELTTPTCTTKKTKIMGPVHKARNFLASKISTFTVYTIYMYILSNCLTWGKRALYARLACGPGMRVYAWSGLHAVF